MKLPAGATAQQQPTAAAGASLIRVVMATVLEAGLVMQHWS